MDRKVLILGVLAYLMSCCLGAENVTVNNDVKVKPSEPGNQVDVTLNCTGSRSELSFYIKNSVQWSFTNAAGRTVPLTKAFYPAPNAEEMFKIGSPERHYEISYEQINEHEGSGYVFRLTILSVTHSDNGIYRCSLLNEANSVTDFKDVKLTVVSPVESLSLQLHRMNDSVLSQSSSPITENDTKLEIAPGQYMVRCDATGSNPEPIMSFHYNDDKVYVSVDVNARVEGERMHYMGSFCLDSITLNASSSPQELICIANIQGSFFPNTVAGISLLVQADKLVVDCENATARVGDRRIKLICTLSAEGSNDNLYCDKVSWDLSKINRNIQSGERWSDGTKAYDTIEAKCENNSDGLKVYLDLYTVKEALFDETFFVVYGIGENAHRYPVFLYDVKYGISMNATPTGAAMITRSLPAVGLVVTALVSTLLARL